MTEVGGVTEVGGTLMGWEVGGVTEVGGTLMGFEMLSRHGAVALTFFGNVV